MPVKSDSIILLQIHSGIHRSHKIPVSIEHQRLAPAEFADAALGRLAPSWVVHVRIHVGIKTVFLGRHAVPGSRRLTRDELYLHDRLYPFEAIFQWHYQPDRCAILVWQ